MATYNFKLPFVLKPHFKRMAAIFYSVEFAIPPLLAGAPSEELSSSPQPSATPKRIHKYVLYLRQSRRPHSTLSVEKQRADALALMPKGERQIAEVFIEDEPLTDGKRPALEAAIAYCKTRKTRLIIGQVSRMRGTFSWLERLSDEGIYFIGADVPTINKREFYRVRLHENGRRREINQAIKSALAQSKAEGTALGGKRQNAEGLEAWPCRKRCSASPEGKIEVSKHDARNRAAPPPWHHLAHRHCNEAQPNEAPSPSRRSMEPCTGAGGD